MRKGSSLRKMAGLLAAVLLAGCLAPEPPPSPDDPRIIKGMEEKLDKALRERQEECDVRVRERAEQIVDSLVIRQLRKMRRDSLELPPQMPRPLRPAAKPPSDTGPVEPLWTNSLQPLLDSLLLLDSLNTRDSLNAKDSL